MRGMSGYFLVCLSFLPGLSFRFECLFKFEFSLHTIRFCRQIADKAMIHWAGSRTLHTAVAHSLTLHVKSPRNIQCASSLAKGSRPAHSLTAVQDVYLAPQ